MGVRGDRDRAGWGWLPRAVAELLVPVHCPGCGRHDVACCAGCRDLLAGRPWRCEDAAPRLDRMDGRPALPVWTVAPYVTRLRGVVVAWKDRGRADLTPVLGSAMAELAVQLVPELADRCREAGAAALVVVPVPSSAASRRRRGADLVRGLGSACATALTEAGLPTTCLPLLAMTRRVRDQVGLGARDRAVNLAGAFTARRRPPRGSCCLLVDDVLTTGATLAQCELAVQAAGGIVIGAVTLAATPAPARGSELSSSPPRD